MELLFKKVVQPLEGKKKKSYICKVLVDWNEGHTNFCNTNLSTFKAILRHIKKDHSILLPASNVCNEHEVIIKPHVVLLTIGSITFWMEFQLLTIRTALRNVQLSSKIFIVQRCVTQAWLVFYELDLIWKMKYFLAKKPFCGSFFKAILGFCCADKGA